MMFLSNSITWAKKKIDEFNSDVAVRPLRDSFWPEWNGTFQGAVEVLIGDLETADKYIADLEEQIRELREELNNDSIPRSVD